MRSYSPRLMVCADLTLILVASSIAFSPALAAPAATHSTPTVVLDTIGWWRIHQTLKPPVIQMDDGLKVCTLEKMPWVNGETAPPEAGWFKPDFDDHGWPRGVARMTCLTPYLAKICLRGKFVVSDPSKVQNLRLSIGYHGGVIVYVNGVEAARSHVPPGALSGETLAEPYPAEAFQFDDGSLMTYWKGLSIRSGNPLFELRNRELKNTEIPPRLLRKGVNVLAVEIIRSAYPKIVDEKKDPKKDYWNFAWNTCEFGSIQLTADSPDGLEPNVARPTGFQVWNGTPMANDYDSAYGDPTEPLRPIEMHGARHGTFSGKVMVGSTKPIRGLKAVPEALKGPGVIPAEQIHIRYAVPWGDDFIISRICNKEWQSGLLGCLTDKPPEEVAVVKRGAWGRGRLPNQPEPAAGATTAVWLTIQVPRDAKPGAYSGAIRIEADGEKPTVVPIELFVADWTLPDPQNYRTWVEILQSPETLAMEYDVPMWSEKHWELIGQSFRLVRDSGSRVAYVPLAAETNFGNDRSMVRWIKKSDGSYDYDFSIMDRYLDTVEKNQGPLKFVAFPVWEVYMLQKEQFQGREYHKKFMEEKGMFSEKGPLVTVFDPATKSLENVELPKFTDPASKNLWKPLFDQIRERLKRRGVKLMMIGMMNDACPSKDELAFFAEIAPDFPWVVHAHGVYTKTNVGYQATVWGCKHAEEKSLMGWKNPELTAMFNRDPNLDECSTSEWRYRCEFAITGNTRGSGRIGADYWKVIKDKKGQRVGRTYNRYPQSNWRNLDIYTAVLAPGPDGLGTTNRYEVFREGLQECEARIAIEEALSDPQLRVKLGSELAARCEKLLDERLRAMQLSYASLINRLEENPARLSNLSGGSFSGHLWNMNSGVERRAKEIFILAGEVEQKIGKRQ